MVFAVVVSGAVVSAACAVPMGPVLLTVAAVLGFAVLAIRLAYAAFAVLARSWLVRWISVQALAGSVKPVDMSLTHTIAC